MGAGPLSSRQRKAALQTVSKVVKPASMCLKATSIQLLVSTRPCPPCFSVLINIFKYYKSIEKYAFFKISIAKTLIIY